MHILTSSCGGRGDHSILNVDADFKDNIVILTIKESYYNDYSPVNVAESERVFSDEIAMGDSKPDKDFLYNCVIDLLKKKRITDYCFEKEDIVFI